MSTTEPKPSRSRNPILDTLNTSFKVFNDCQPLAVGIHKIIKERLPEISTEELRNAIRFHAASTRYLKALSQANTRFDLDGSPAGRVTEEQRQYASDTLRERFKKQAERHKADQLVKKQVQQRQESLLKLAEKFNAR